MKLKTFIAVCAIVGICGWQAGAQLTGNQSIGAYSVGGRRAINPSSYSLGTAQENEIKQSILNGHPYRKIRGEIYNMYADCYPFWVKVEHRESNGVLIVGHETPERYGVNIETYAITNYLGEVVTGRTIAIVARRVGTYNLDSQDSVVELYDCGTMLAPEEEREQIAKAQAEQNAKLKAEADAKAAETRKKIEIADAAKAKALKSNQDEAAKVMPTACCAWASDTATATAWKKIWPKPKSIFKKQRTPARPPQPRNFQN